MALFGWASRLLQRFENLGIIIAPFLKVTSRYQSKFFLNKNHRIDPRRLFGAKEVEEKLKASKVSLDGLFTGVDCPHAAMMQISAACRRRKLRYLQGKFLILSREQQQTNLHFSF